MTYQKTGLSPYSAFRKACRLVVEHCPDQYAKEYAKVGLTMNFNIEDMRTQALYIKSNLSHWRGEVAKEAKLLLKEVG